MRYPVGGGTRDEFIRDWYIADGFGSYRVIGSYYHEALDINLRTGGNTDLGQELHAISRGKLVYYHRNSHPTTGFGRHNVYEIRGQWGVRWVHSAHCLDDGFVGEVRDLNEGDVTGKLGSSGNSVSAHLHFAIFRVDPATLPRGIDSIAKTVQQLNDWWENPLEFIERYYGEEDDMSELHDYLGVQTDDEAKAKLKEHLGEWEGKCDWGNADDNRGGYLGGERRKVKSLEQQLKDCEEDSGGVVPGVPDGWVPNGYETTVYSDGNTSITTNYRKE